MNQMLKKDATVTICHSKTKNIKEYTLMADIVVLATGKPNLIDKTYIKEKTTVIDVGINKVDGKLCGDANENIKEVCENYTPVPGGVGPMTIAMLMANIVKAAKNS